MAKSKSKIGPSLDDFLKEEGLYEECHAMVQKRVLADQLRAEMNKREISVSALARRMRVSRTTVQSLLDPDSDSATLVTMARAAQAVGGELRLELVPQRAARATKRSG